MTVNFNPFGSNRERPRIFGGLPNPALMAQLRKVIEAQKNVNGGEGVLFPSLAKKTITEGSMKATHSPPVTTQSEQLVEQEQNKTQFLSKIRVGFSQIKLPGFLKGLKQKFTRMRLFKYSSLETVQEKAPRLSKGEKIVNGLIKELRAKGGANTEGIFRISGEKETIDNSYKKVKKGKVDENTLVPIKVLELGGLIKTYLRENPLFEKPPEARALYLNAGDSKLSKEERIENLKKALESLPKEKKAILRTLVSFCDDVIANQKTTLMNEKNLAICLAPNMLNFPEGLAGMTDTMLSNSAMTLLLENRKLLGG